MAKLTVVVSALVETQLTGFIGAHEKTIRGHLWRVEWYSGKAVKFLRDGVAREVDIHKNRAVANLMMASYNFFRSV